MEPVAFDKEIEIESSKAWSNDAWFIGFSPDLVAGVWVGFDAPQTLGPNDTGA